MCWFDTRTSDAVPASISSLEALYLATLILGKGRDEDQLMSEWRFIGK